MIKLDEKDVKAVGKARFIRTHDKQLMWVLLGGVALFGVLAHFTAELKTPLYYIPTVPLIGLIIYMVWYIKRIYKVERALVKEWKEDGNKSV